MSHLNRLDRSGSVLGGLGWVVLTGLIGIAAGSAAGQPAQTPGPDARTGVVELAARTATIHGQTARFMELEGIGNICYWTDAQDWVSWNFTVEKTGDYVVELKYSCQDGSEGSTFEVTLAGHKLEAAIAKSTGTWSDHEYVRLGNVAIDQAGAQTLELKPVRKPGQAVMNLAWIRLIPADGYKDYLKRTAKERGPAARGDLSKGVYVLPNFHPASCGWLADWSTERNYCGYSYLAHLDRVRDDPTYAYNQSEVNNLMAIIAFEPQRVEELKQRIKEGRAELVNAFFLEPSISLSGGEALVKMGVEGLRWQQEVMGVRPRTAWMIDVCGVHEQMAQIVAGLGLDALVYVRDNPTDRLVHWFESPDGTRILTLNAGDGYADWGDVFHSQEALSKKTLDDLLADAKGKARRTPAGLPVMVLGGYGDYSLPPRREQYPREFLEEWGRANPDVQVRFVTLSQYLDAMLPVVRSGAVELPVARSGARFNYTAFWIENWPVKTRYRHAEHALQAAEMAASAANVKVGASYPVQPLYHAWLLMLLNMDRNTLWGSAAGKVFESHLSWDAKDRFNTVETISSRTTQAGVKALLGEGDGIALYNPFNWKRTDPVLLTLPEGTRPANGLCQADSDGRTLCRVELDAAAARGLEIERQAAEKPRAVPVPAVIETAFYTARVDAANGALVSVKTKPAGREVLGGPVILVAETGKDGDFAPERKDRKRLTDSSQFEAKVTALEGPLATVVEARTTFIGGGQALRRIRFLKDSPRIEFENEMEDIPNNTVVVAEFPLAADIREVRRGVPYGFSHGAWSVPNRELPGITDGIAPAVRWSHYQLDGCGVALLDYGLSGRELTGRTPVLFLLNAQDLYVGYPCAWLSGKGKQYGRFAMVAHDGDFRETRVPRMAWEFNYPPVIVEGVGKKELPSIVETSENVIVEALRREGADLELRMAECMGAAGTATVRMALPHGKAYLTDLTGANPKELPGGPEYQIPVRPQQIVTIRFRTDKPVEAIQPLMKWDELVPANKLMALRKKLPNAKGHPPRGTNGPFPTLPADIESSLTMGKPAVVSGTYQNAAAYAADLAVDADESTRWAAEAGAKTGWVEVDLGKPEQIGRAYLGEAFDRVSRFELQRYVDGEWRSFAQGTKIGLNLELRFEPVTAQRVRLNILEASDGPTIWEFHLFGP